MVRELCRALVVLLVLLSPLQFLHAASGELHSIVSPRSGQQSDAFDFEVSLLGEQAGDEPQLYNVEDFEVTLRGTSQSVRIINGDTSVVRTWHYQLIPKRVGTLQSPGARIATPSGLLDAPPHQVTVTKGEDVASLGGGAKDISLTQKVTTPGPLYVGQQLGYELQLRSLFPIVQAASENLSFPFFWSKQIGDEARERKTIHGSSYDTISLHHALYPLKSGSLELPPVAIQMQVQSKEQGRSRSPFGNGFPFNIFGQDPFAMRRLKELRVHSNSLSIDVLPLPPVPQDLPQGLPVVVGKSSLSMTSNAQTIQAGEEKTVVVTVQSEGMLESLKELPLAQSRTFRVYAGKPEESSLVRSSRLVATKRFQYSVVPLRGGTIEIPAIQLLQFNPILGSYSILSTKPFSFEVTGDVPGQASPSGESSIVPAPVVQDNTSEQAASPVKQERTPGRWAKLGKVLSSRALLFSALGLCLVLALVALVVSVWQKRAKQQALKARIHSARDADELQALLRELIERMDPRLKCADSPELRRRLVAAGDGVSPEIREALRLIESCHTLRYSSPSGQDAHLRDLISETEKLAERSS